MRVRDVLRSSEAYSNDEAHQEAFDVLVGCLAQVQEGVVPEVAEDLEEIPTAKFQEVPQICTKGFEEEVHPQDEESQGEEPTQVRASCVYGNHVEQQVVGGMILEWDVCRS